MDKTKILLRIKELSPTAKEYMLLDLAWKAKRQTVMQSLILAEVSDGKTLEALQDAERR